jgi:hypothetical protein
MRIEWKREPIDMAWIAPDGTRWPIEDATCIVIRDDGPDWRRPTAEDYRRMGWDLVCGEYLPPFDWPPGEREGVIER